MEESTSSEIYDSISILSINVDQTLALRRSVLWPNSPVSHVQLPEDQNGYHFGAFIPSYNEPIAVISLFEESLGTTWPGKAVRFRKFACLQSHQGRGVGTKLLKHVVSIAIHELNATTVWCDARVASADWYRRRGMVSFGETFPKGPVEYIRMKMSSRTKVHLHISSASELSILRSCQHISHMNSDD